VTAAARLTEDVIGCTVLADTGYDSDAFLRELMGTITFPSSRAGKTGTKKSSMTNGYTGNGD
jgi:hypothetical protein